jgi:hypothetical protein
MEEREKVETRSEKFQREWKREKIKGRVNCG